MSRPFGFHKNESIHGLALLVFQSEHALIFSIAREKEIGEKGPFAMFNSLSIFSNLNYFLH